MTREESWAVESDTLALLRRITDAGYVVSVHRIPGSLLGTVPATVEMHAVNPRTHPLGEYVAAVAGLSGRMIAALSRLFSRLRRRSQNARHATVPTVMTNAPASGAQKIRERGD